MRLIDLKQNRAALVSNMRSLLTKAETENRGLNTEERASYDAMRADELSLHGRIEALEAQEGLERVVNEQRSNHEQTATAGAPTYDEAFRQWLGSVTGAVSPEARSVLQPRAASNENRTYVGLSEGVSANGGYTVPTGFLAVLTEAMKFYGGIRNTKATVIKTASGNTLQIPTVNDATNEGSIIGEAVADAFTTATFAQTSISAYKYTSGIMPVSHELMQDSTFDLASYVAKWMGQRLGRRINRDLTVGDGSAKPSGLIPAAATVTAASATAIALDDIQNLIYSVDAAYRNNGAQFMVHDQVWSKLVSLKDSTGRYLINGIQVGTAVGQPDTLLGRPVVFNQHMNSALTTGLPVLAFGDFSSYLIRDAMEPTVVRFNERFADQYMVGFSCIARCDGKYINAGTDPIKVLKLA